MLIRIKDNFLVFGFEFFMPLVWIDSVGNWNVSYVAMFDPAEAVGRLDVRIIKNFLGSFGTGVVDNCRISQLSFIYFNSGFCSVFIYCSCLFSTYRNFKRSYFFRNHVVSSAAP